MSTCEIKLKVRPALKRSILMLSPLILMIMLALIWSPFSQFSLAFQLHFILSPCYWEIGWLVATTTQIFLEMSANSPAVLVRRLLSITVLMGGSLFHVAAACQTVQLHFSHVEGQFLGVSLSRYSQKLMPLDWWMRNSVTRDVRNAKPRGCADDRIHRGRHSDGRQTDRPIKWCWQTHHMISMLTSSR